VTADRDSFQQELQTRQLRRLEVLMDVVFAVVVWQFFSLIPLPTQSGDLGSLFNFLASELEAFAAAAIGVAIVIIYWLQNNALFGRVERTDSRHASIAILQIFFLLLFLYAVRVGIAVEASTETRAFESLTAALVGIASVAGWYYASHGGRLTSPSVSREDSERIFDRILAEPLTATLALACAFVGPILWEVSWLTYPLIALAMRRRREKKRAKV
jgi:uncharacterized membrane protein